MEIIKNEQYEEIAATYQCLEIGRLNDILKLNGIEDKSLRQRICAEFFSSSGQFLDSGWFMSEDTRYCPELSFSQRPFDYEDGLGEINKLHVQTEDFAFQEYVAGDIEWVFDEHGESTEDIPNGIA